MKPAITVFLLAAACGTAAAQSFPLLMAERQSVQVIHTADPVFPASLQMAGVLKGEARVVFSVDHTGKLGEYLVIAYSHRAFADATVDAIKQWRFEPMRIGGEPRSAQIEVSVSFERTKVVVNLDLTTFVTSRFEDIFGPDGYRPRTLREIDRIPTPVITVPPEYPESFRERGMRGVAIVGFFIDEAGTVRMPAVTTADHEDLGVLAVAALKQWRFEPPMQNGTPVLVRAQQIFRFGM